MSSDNEIIMTVNGDNYSQFKEARVVKSLDAIGGTFEIIIASDFITNTPIRMEDEIQITVNGDVIISGNIDIVSSSYDDSAHDITISGQDITGDVVEATIFTTSTYQGDISLKSLIELVMSDNGVTDIGVIDIVTTDENKDELIFKANEVKSGDVGDTLFDFMDKYAKIKNCLLTSDGEGNIIIYRTSKNQKAISALRMIIGEDESNYTIKTSNLSVDYTNRFKKIIIKSQSDGDSDISGEFEDSFVRRPRTKVIISDNSLTIKEAEDMARWEVVNRQSQSTVYRCNVYGFSSDSGKVWAPNDMVSIRDDIQGVDDIMILRDVEYSISEDDGSITSLTFVSKDSFISKPKVENTGEPF